MSYLTDSKGNKSSARLNVMLWSIGIFVMWVMTCVIKKELVDIPMGLGAVLGYVVGGKTIQSFAEKKSD